MTSTPPVLFLSHGAPPLADDARWTAELARWSAEIERPKNILMVSAHWEDAPVTVSPSQRKVPLTYDFWGFPQRYYEVTYEAPLAPELADDDPRPAPPGHRPGPCSRLGRAAPRRRPLAAQPGEPVRRVEVLVCHQWEHFRTGVPGQDSGQDSASLPAITSEGSLTQVKNTLNINRLIDLAQCG